MRIYLLLILFLMLWDGGALVGAETVHKAAEGGDITVGCTFYISGSKKIFCKNDCNKEDILVETSGNRERNGRYSIEYKEVSLPNPDLMFVNITKLTRSDSGRYSCVLERTFLIDGKHEFRIEVTKDASLNPIFTLKPNDPPSPFTVKTTADIPSFLTVTPTEQSLTQAPVSFKESTTAPSGAPSGFIYLLLLLIPVVMAIVFGLIFYRKRKYQNGENNPTEQRYKAQETTKRGADTEMIYENLSPPPASSQTDNIYQSLSSSTRDHNQIYSTLTALPQGSSRSETNTNTETSPPAGKCYNLYN